MSNFVSRSVRNRLLPMVVVGVVCWGLAGPCISDASAQTLFKWQATDPTFSRYTTPEDCKAAVIRVQRGTHWGAQQDTASWNPSDTLPTIVVTTARQCLTRLAMPVTDPLSLGVLTDLYLIAGQDEQALAVAEQRIRGESTDSLQQQLGILNIEIQRAMSQQPVRLKFAKALIARADSMIVAAERSNSPQMAPVWQEGLNAHGALFAYGEKNGDTTIMRSTFATIHTYFDKMSKSPDAEPGLIMLARFGLMLLAAPLNALSLKKGTEEYLRITRARVDSLLIGFAAMRGQNSEQTMAFQAQYYGMLGKPAPAIAGNFWYEHDRAAGPRPSIGKVGLIISVDQVCGTLCQRNFAVLKRFSQRFGTALEVTVLAKTHGYFRKRPPPQVAQEAEALRSYFLGYHKLPGALSVSETPFTVLPDPDRRRMDDATENEQQGYWINPWDNQYVIVSPQGIVMYRGALTPETENIVAMVIELVLETAAREAKEVLGK